jgi:DNA-binding NtrC family response regulator
MAGCLRKSGYQVVASSNGAEVLRGLGADEPNFDLLVTDILMPGGLNGLQLAAQLTSAKPTLRVIAITGHYEAKEPQTLPGNLMRLPKPFTVETLLSRVRQCLDAK